MSCCTSMMPCCTCIWCHVVRCMMPCCTCIWCHVVQVYDAMLYRCMMPCCTGVCHVVQVYDAMLYRCMMSCCTGVWCHVVQVYDVAEREQHGTPTVPVYRYFEWNSNIPVCLIAVSFSSVCTPEVLLNYFRKCYTPDLPRVLWHTQIEWPPSVQQTCGQIHLYLKVFKYFKNNICICIWHLGIESICINFVFKYFPKVFDISNTFQIL